MFGCFGVVAAILVVVVGLTVIGALVVLRGSSRNHVQDFALGPGQREVVPVDLSKGEVLSVAVVVVGDPSVDIAVWLEDPDGATTEQTKRGHSVTFDYGAVQNGIHHLIVLNDALFASKTVSVTWKVEP